MKITTIGLERSEKLGLFIGDQMILIPRVLSADSRPTHDDVRTEIWFEVSGTWDCQDDPQNGEHLTGEVGVFPNPVSAQRVLDEWKETQAPCPKCLRSRRPEKVSMEVPTIKELVVIFAAPAAK